jgi:hypothetical protein
MEIQVLANDMEIKVLANDMEIQFLAKDMESNVAGAGTVYYYGA